MFKLSKDNNPNNAIYIRIVKNTVYITANIYFYEYAYQDQHLFGSQQSCIDLAIEGIQDKWSYSFTGTEYDFIPGMKVTLDTKVNYIMQSQYPKMYKDKDFLTINLYNRKGVPKFYCNDIPILKYMLSSEKHWSVSNKSANIELYPQDSRGRQIKKTVDTYKKTAAHEFGHALGLNDLYPEANHLERDGSEYIDCNSGEVSQYHIMSGKQEVAANDLEMVLYAFSENKWQQYYNSKKYKQ